MVVLVKLIGIIKVIAGSLYLGNLEILKKVANYMVNGKRLYFSVALSLLIGILLLNAASYCAAAWIIKFFGIVAITKGIVIIALGKKKLLSMVQWLENSPEKNLRIISGIAIALGVIIIYAA